MDTPEIVRSLGDLWREARPESGDALVFASASGGPLDYANVYRRVFKPATKRAGVEWATAHTLRHTFKTQLERNGYRPDEVSTLLGHHAIEFTANAYGDRPHDVRAPEFLDAITSAERARPDDQEGGRSASDGSALRGEGGPS